MAKVLRERQVKWTVQVVCSRNCDLSNPNLPKSVRLPLIARQSSIANTMTDLLEDILPAGNDPTAFVRRQHVHIEFWRALRHIVVRIDHCPSTQDSHCALFKLPTAVRVYNIATAVAKGAAVVLSTVVLARMVSKSERFGGPP